MTSSEIVSAAGGGDEVFTQSKFKAVFGNRETQTSNLVSFYVKDDGSNHYVIYRLYNGKMYDPLCSFTFFGNPYCGDEYSNTAEITPFGVKYSYDGRTNYYVW